MGSFIRKKKALEPPELLMFMKELVFLTVSYYVQILLIEIFGKRSFVFFD